MTLEVTVFTSKTIKIAVLAALCVMPAVQFCQKNELKKNEYGKSSLLALKYAGLHAYPGILGGGVTGMLLGKCQKTIDPEGLALVGAYIGAPAYSLCGVVRASIESERKENNDPIPTNFERVCSAFNTTIYGGIIGGFVGHHMLTEANRLKNDFGTKVCFLLGALVGGGFALKNEYGIKKQKNKIKEAAERRARFKAEHDRYLQNKELEIRIAKAEDAVEKAREEEKFAKACVKHLRRDTQTLIQRLQPVTSDFNRLQSLRKAQSSVDQKHVCEYANNAGETQLAKAKAMNSPSIEVDHFASAHNDLGQHIEKVAASKKRKEEADKEITQEEIAQITKTDTAEKNKQQSEGSTVDNGSRRLIRKFQTLCVLGKLREGYDSRHVKA